ncbi:hypothetical protein MMC20_002936 [Loxospora ochrophaea]|nr:hypothetical protein [Loxospora ochrophaea]
MRSFIPLLLLAAYTQAQSTTDPDSGYIGYSLSQNGDPDSTVYDTADTTANVSLTVPPPDVYLNASLFVGEIDIEVQNLTAKINLAAQVLSLLTFNAGVDASIDRVSLQIQNVTAKVVLEARLSNLVLMIDDVLSSLDLNPVLATLGQDVGSITNATVGALGGGPSSSNTSATPNLKRTMDPESYNLLHNILYSVNDYSGNTHTNRILTQRGSILDESLNNNGHVTSDKVVGSYAADMLFNGYNVSATFKGEAVRELEYTYSPFPGLAVVSAIYVDGEGKVVGTQVLSESSAGGGSTISSD